jgi:hypothetical protein
LLEIAIDLARGIDRQRNQSRLVKLRIPDEENAFVGIVVAEPETYNLGASESRRIEQDNCEPTDLWMQGRERIGREVIGSE